MPQTTEKAVKYAVSLGLDVMYVTEDTSRCDPETSEAAVHHCDSMRRAGNRDLRYGRPFDSHGRIRTSCKFVMEKVVKPSGENIRVEWHGHCDRGLAVANSMAAFVAGAELRARYGARHRRAGWQYANGSNAGESQADGYLSVG